MIDHRSVYEGGSARPPVVTGAHETAPVALAGHEQSENFPVALRLLPRHYRRDLRAVYAFARGVDELGDTAPGDRLAQLARFDAELGRIWSGGPVHDPVLADLAATVREHNLPAEPFHRLVAANVQDQRVSRYESYDDLRGYCRLSADPVGRIVLGVFGEAGSARTVELSDRVCTALQLLEHWQDVGEDRRAGRVYLPQQDLRAYAVPETDLDRAAATPELAALMRTEIDRAADLLADGAAIVGRLRGWARPCVAGFVAGGRATVAALRRSDGDVLGRPTAPSKPGTAVRLLRICASSVTGGPA
jgi:squalene synthase HpnC